MNPEVVFDSLLEASGRVVLIAGFVAAALALFRAKSPALRHVVWAAVMVTMMTLPVLAGWLPTFQIPLGLKVPSFQQMAVDNVPGVAVVYHWLPPAPTTRSSSGGAISAGLPPTPAQPLSPARSMRMPATTAGQDWRANAVLVWAIAAAFLLVREAVGWRLARRLAAQGVRAAVGDGT